MPTADEPRVTVRLSRATYDGLVRIAAEQECSVGSLVRQLADSLVVDEQFLAVGAVGKVVGRRVDRALRSAPVMPARDLLRERQVRLNKQMGWTPEAER